MPERETLEEAYREAMATQRAAQNTAARKAYQRGERQGTAAPEKADYNEANIHIDALKHLGEKGVLQVENLANEMNVIHELGQEKGEVVVGLWKAMIMERQRNFSEITTRARKQFVGRDEHDPEVMIEMSAFLLENMLPFYEEMVDKLRRARMLKSVFVTEEERHHLENYLDRWLHGIRDSFEKLAHIQKNETYREASNPLDSKMR